MTTSGSQLVRDWGPRGPVAKCLLVLGPPAAGKSTFIGALSQAHPVAVFVMRNAVAWADQSRPDWLKIAGPRDELGWISDEAVRNLLQMTFEPFGLFSPPPPDLLLFDNFPGSGDQVEQLWNALRGTYQQFQLAAVELLAADATIMARAAQRLVCSRCTVVPPPKQSTLSQLGQPRCIACGTKLLPREDDQLDMLKKRIDRFRTNAPGVRSALSRFGIRHICVGADAQLDAVGLMEAAFRGRQHITNLQTGQRTPA
jgi:adenylate kinase family enzyme